MNGALAQRHKALLRPRVPGGKADWRERRLDRSKEFPPHPWPSPPSGARGFVDPPVAIGTPGRGRPFYQWLPLPRVR